MQDNVLKVRKKSTEADNPPGSQTKGIQHRIQERHNVPSPYGTFGSHESEENSADHKQVPPALPDSEGKPLLIIGKRSV